GKGDGTFDASVDYMVGPGYVTRVLGLDVNGDGLLDLVFDNASNSTVNVMLNRRRRRFSSVASYPTGGFTPYGLISGDFNEDGHPDLAVANNNSNNMAVLLNNGNGTFAAPVTYGAGDLPAMVATGDFNGDAHLDLAVSNYVSGDID